MPPSSLPHSFLAFPLDQMPRITSRLIACRLIAMRVTPLPPLVNNLLTRVIWPPYLREAFISPLHVTPLGTAERQKPVDIHLTGQLNVCSGGLSGTGRKDWRAEGKNTVFLFFPPRQFSVPFPSMKENCRGGREFKEVQGLSDSRDLSTFVPCLVRPMVK